MAHNIQLLPWKKKIHVKAWRNEVFLFFELLQAKLTKEKIDIYISGLHEEEQEPKKQFAKHCLNEVLLRLKPPGKNSHTPTTVLTWCTRTHAQTRTHARAHTHTHTHTHVHTHTRTRTHTCWWWWWLDVLLAVEKKKRKTSCSVYN